MVKSINEHTSYDLSDMNEFMRFASSVAKLAVQDVKHDRPEKTGLQVITYLNVRHKRPGHVKLSGTIYRAYREFLTKQEADK